MDTFLFLFACKYSTVIWKRNNYHFQNAQGRNNGRLKVIDGLLVNDMKECDIFTTNEGLQHTTEHDLMHISLLQVKLLYSNSTVWLIQKSRPVITFLVKSFKFQPSVQIMCYHYTCF